MLGVAGDDGDRRKTVRLGFRVPRGERERRESVRAREEGRKVEHGVARAYPLATSSGTAGIGGGDRRRRRRHGAASSRRETTTIFRKPP